MNLNIGQMVHQGDYVVSIAARPLARQDRRGLGVEILNGFAAADVVMDDAKTHAIGVKLVERGLDKHGQPQPNHFPGETIEADIVILAEGCDGLLTERFVTQAGGVSNPLGQPTVLDRREGADQGLRRAVPELWRRGSSMRWAIRCGRP